MFKNAIVYRITKAPDSLRVGTVALNFHMFAPCGATQEKSMGWVPPRGQEHGALLESVGGQYILKLMTETKSVPADVVKRRVEEDCKHIEETTGRKPGKKERREIKADALLALLPMAFRKQRATLIWIDPRDNRIAIDASSQSKADEVVTMLLKSFEGLALQMINTVLHPAAGMARWLVTKEAPDGFSIDRECELKACDESKAVVKYGRHPLDIDEVAQHIRLGKMPTKLALTWNDRVSFVLTEGLQIKKIQLLDVAFENTESPGDKDADHFDADVAIFTGEMVRLLPALFAVLGGEVEAA
jgi:recombination associated protein RdgC